MTAAEMRSLETFLNTYGPEEVRMKDARLMMEILGLNLTMLPEGEDEILSLGTGTHPILNNFRDAHVRL